MPAVVHREAAGPSVLPCVYLVDYTFGNQSGACETQFDEQTQQQYFTTPRQQDEQITTREIRSHLENI